MDNRARALTAAEVAEELNVTRLTIYRLISRGEISSFKVGAATRIPRSEVERIKAGVPVATK